MKDICRTYGISKSGYYKRLKAEPVKAMYEQSVISEVKNIRKAHPQYGLRKVCAQMARDKHPVSRDKLWRMMQKHALMLPRKYRKIRTSIFLGAGFQPTNLIKGVEATGKNQIWVTDITYIITLEGVLYMSAIMDLYSRKIISHSISTDLTTNSSILCLRKALKTTDNPAGIIHHSDRGCQYCSHAYRDILNTQKMSISYTGKDHCYDNAKMERFFNTLKHEYGLHGILKSMSLAKELINCAVNDYNGSRLHAALKYRIPNEVYSDAA